MLTVTAYGTATADPVSRETKAGSLTTVNMAVNHKRRDEETTTWVTCTFWGKQAETALAYIKKGHKFLVSGEAQVRAYSANNGDAKASLELKVSSLELGPKGAASSESASSSGGRYMDDEDDIPPF